MNLILLEKWRCPARLRACLSALDDLETLFKGCGAYPIVRQRAETMIVSRQPKRHLMNYLNNEDYVPRQVALCLIEACALDLISSGLFKLRPGVLDDVGESIRAVYQIATDRLEAEDYYSREEKAERLKNLTDAVARMD